MPPAPGGRHSVATDCAAAAADAGICSPAAPSRAAKRVGLGYGAEYPAFGRHRIDRGTMMQRHGRAQASSISKHS